MIADSADADRYWLETLQLVVSRASHELKGALNGVSVNLEVVRGRAASASQPATAVARFAESAAGQLDVVIAMNESLLGLARRAREPVDVATVLRQLAGLLVPVATAGATPVTVQVDEDGLGGSTAAPPAAVRTVLARTMLALLDAGGGAVALSIGADGTTVTAAPVRAGMTMDAATAAVAADAGIRTTTTGSTITLSFPAGLPAGSPTATTTTHGIA